ncbi:MAG: hypothetical protein ACRDQA_19800 [Nocardioidaceae bacterium]
MREMTVLFEEETGRLRLDRPSFDALVAIAAGIEPPAEGAERVRDAGIVRGTIIHPGIAPGIVAAESAVAHASLAMHDDSGTVIGAEIWIGTESAAYLMTTSSDLLELITTGPAFFPVSVARIVGLGPRPRPALTPWRMPVELVEQLVATDAAERTRAAETVAASIDDPTTREFLDQVVEGPFWYWALQVEWAPATGHDPGRSLHIIDTQKGLAILSLSEDRIAVDPITPTAVWQLLTMILPRDDELAFSR